MKRLTRTLALTLIVVVSAVAVQAGAPGTSAAAHAASGKVLKLSSPLTAVPAKDLKNGSCTDALCGSNTCTMRGRTYLPGQTLIVRSKGKLYAIMCNGFTGLWILVG